VIVKSTRAVDGRRLFQNSGNRYWSVAKVTAGLTL